MAETENKKQHERMDSLTRSVLLHGQNFTRETSEIGELLRVRAKWTDFFLSCPSCMYLQSPHFLYELCDNPLKNVRVTTWAHIRVPSSLYPLPITRSTCLMKNIWPRQVHTDIFSKVFFNFPLICVLVNKSLNLLFFLPLICLIAFRLLA